MKLKFKRFARMAGVKFASAKIAEMAADYIEVVSEREFAEHAAKIVDGLAPNRPVAIIGTLTLAVFLSPATPVAAGYLVKATVPTIRSMIYGDDTK